MALYKRSCIWWIDFATPRGAHIRRSAQTRDKAVAQELHNWLRGEAWRIQQMGVRPAFMSGSAHKCTLGDDIAKLAWLQQFLRGRPLVRITREEIAAIGLHNRADASSATANRYLVRVRTISRKAWKVKFYRDPKRRMRWATPEQAKVLLDELPEHRRDIILLVLATGLHRANVTQLGWQQVDLDRDTCWVAGEPAKAGEYLHVSLNDVTQDALRCQRGKHPVRVFTYKKRPFTQVNTRAWRKALQRAGIANFRRHDLRHTRVSWLVPHGTPLHDVQEMCDGSRLRWSGDMLTWAPAKLARPATVVDGLLAPAPP